MTQLEAFGGAKWIAAEPEFIKCAPLFRKDFELASVKSAKIRIIGLGTFVAYLNGKRISEDLFLPFVTEYEKSDMPKGEELTGFRTYITEYDITDYLVIGRNSLAVIVGAGWYNGTHYDARTPYGEKKLIFSVTVTAEDGSQRQIVSDGEEFWRPSFVVSTDQNKGECHDFTDWRDSLLYGEPIGEGFGRVRLSRPVDTDYQFTSCPADRVIRVVLPTVVYKCEEYTIYDAGANISGYPVLVSEEGYVGEVEVTPSEDINEARTDIDEGHVWWQHVNATVTGVPTEIYPRFTWLAFRYFRVRGGASVKEVKIVHSKIDVTSSFTSDNEVLNWTYNAYILTQLTNMHRGLPSDCPHIERLGYTGDGQLCARSAIMSLGAREFYAKWIQDISDCQDTLTGRVQYTAPYAYAGGGPGGWGCAIVVVPYEFYKFYGDDTYIRRLYPQMLRYFDFLDASSECGVITRFKEGCWCLGDWCTPDLGTLPTPFVNNYFYAFSLIRAIEIARVIGKEADIPALEVRLARVKRAINTFYFNDFVRDDTYCANAQGAGAFALGIGLGTENTKEKLIRHYDSLGYYDTGIFATELVTRRLFEYGEDDIAFKLLTASEPHGFGKWMKRGSTTLREYWGEKCRSFSHPMFGAVISLFYEYILGIRQEEGTAGYEDVIIAPAYINGLGSVSGHITTPRGKIAVSYVTEGDRRRYTVELADGIRAKIRIKGAGEISVVGGVHVVTA